MIRLRSPSLTLLSDYTPAIFNETLLGFQFGDKWFKDAGILGVFSVSLLRPHPLGLLLFAWSSRCARKFSRTFGSMIFHWPRQSMRLLLTRSSPHGSPRFFALMTQSAHKGDREEASGVQHREKSSAIGFNAGKSLKGVPFFKILRSSRVRMSRLRKRVVLSGPDGKVCFRHC